MQTSPSSHLSPSSSTSSIVDISSSTFSLNNSNIDNLSLPSTDNQFIIPTLPTKTLPTLSQSFHLPRMSHHTGLAQMSHKYHCEAPETFRGRASVTKEFIEEVKIILTKYKVTSDLDKIKGLLRYCSRSVAKFIYTLSSFHTPSWEKLKAEFLHYYDAEFKNVLEVIWYAHPEEGLVMAITECLVDNQRFGHCHIISIIPEPCSKGFYWLSFVFLDKPC